MALSFSGKKNMALGIMSLRFKRNDSIARGLQCLCAEQQKRISNWKKGKNNLSSRKSGIMLRIP